MDNIFENIKDKIEELVARLKGDDDTMSKFKANPLETVKELIGKIDLPDGALENLVDGIKEKLGIGDGAEAAGNAAADGAESIGEKITDTIGDLFGKAKDIFGKKED